MREELEAGLLVEVDGRQGRVVRDLNSFVVVTVGDPTRGFIAQCAVIAVPRVAVKVVDLGE
jgi:hypothetical protein